MNVRVGLALGIGVALGVLADRAWTPRPAPPPAPAAPSAPAAWTPPVDLPSCQSELALARAVLDAQERDRVGVPEQFPADLPAVYTAAGFEGAVRQALAECPDVEVRLAKVDCSEYPCFALFSQPRGGMNHSVEELASCAGWTSRFTNPMRGQANSSFMTDDGPVEWSLLAPTPEGVEPADPENAAKRWQARQDEGAQALMDAWGGRPYTELEQLDQQIAFWESQTDGDEDDAMAPILDKLRRRRDKLAAETAVTAP